MRDILFRGKRMHTDEWTTGGLVKTICGHYGITIMTRYDPDLAYIGALIDEVLPETIGEYTGLKDSNGVKIFEGDIVEFTDTFTHKPEVVRREVFFDTEQLCFHLKYSNELLHCQFSENFTVVGNIHDDPELINK